ncbi:MAG: 3'(2'),5'-bisphosphate nucleotidase CysQ [Plesiomonas sp.]|uniref:3'(2'),5'-bisphosphate nucleotidase CysQ n=1 Tax=Plesiomonas sp. TaxID=2486279 RepID=UPI003F344600
MTPKALLSSVLAIAQEAGQLIADIYQQGDFKQQIKSDHTPVTSADLAAHALITERLRTLTPDIPVLSEEDCHIPLSTRHQWARYWLVDPLDGTQEFIYGSGEFTTIIALIEQHKPTLGVVYAPISKVSYYATDAGGAFKRDINGIITPLQTRKVDEQTKQIILAVSRRQSEAMLAEQLNPDWHYTLLPHGSSSLKSCMVAEGIADAYLRLGPTGEWDTGATQCILHEAGGNLSDTYLKPLSYNQRETLENPNFISIGDPTLPWKTILTN